MRDIIKSMEQPVKIKITKNQVRQIEEIEKTDIIGDEIPDETSSAVSFGTGRTIWEKIGEICLYLLAGLTPLFFLPLTIDPVDINKQVFAGILVLAAFICYLFNSFKKGEISYPKSWLGLAVAILLAVFGASAIFSKAPSTSLFGNLVQPDSLFSFLIYGLAFFLGAVLLKDREDEVAKKIGKWFLGGLAVAVIFGLVQMFGKFILPWGFAKNHSFNTVGMISGLAIFSASGLAVIIGALFSDILGNGKRKILLALLGLLIIFELLILNYPAIWFILALTTLFLAGFKFFNNSKLSPFLITIIVSFIFIGLVGRFFPSPVSLPAEARPNFLTTLGITKDSFSLKNFFVGSGPATFGYNYSLYRPIELNQTNLWPNRFNQGFGFLTTLPTTVGFLGVLAFLFLIFCFAREALRIGLTETRQRKDWFLTISLGIIFLMFSWLVWPINFVAGVFVFLGLGLVAALLTPLEKNSLTGLNSVQEISLTSLSKYRSFAAVSVLIILIAVSFSGLFILGRKYLGAIYYEKGIRIYNQAGNLDKSLAELNKSRQWDSREDQYFRTSSQLLLLKIDRLAGQIAGASPEKKSEIEIGIQNTAAAAIEIARQAATINPADSLNWSNLGNVYEKLIFVAAAADAFAEENYKKAMALDPKNPQEPVNLARSFLTASDLIGSANPPLWQEKLNKAKSYLEQSIALKSDYIPAHFLMAVAAIREGKTQEAITKLELTKELAPFDAGFAFQLGLIYYQNNQLEKARAEFERTIGIEPDFSNARYFLGLIYDRFGNRQAALEQFEKIAKLNPDNEEVKKILNNFREGRGALEEIVPPAKPPAERTEAPVGE